LLSNQHNSFTMLSHLYSYVFGSENIEECSSGPCMRTRTKEDDGWLLVHESASGRSSPIMIAPPQVIEIDELSCHSTIHEGPSQASIRKAEILREAKAANRIRLNLEKAMFAEPPEKPVEKESKVAPKTSATKLKRASVSSIVASESKIKNRSAKAAKMSSGANNNRKCNNLA
ncbi:hypothetical protein PFISCL1PPCAC_19678, partial [Pristionchus fissidentatus]